jgi:hypothetical protein
MTLLATSLMGASVSKILISGEEKSDKPGKWRRAISTFHSFLGILTYIG